LERSVGAADRDLLDQDFTSVRDLEKRLGKSTEWVDRHELTHHGNREDRLDELHLIEVAQISALGEFLKGMDAAKEQGVSRLDQTAVLYGTNMGSANSHANDNLPVLLAGGGFKHAGHLAFDKEKTIP
jgi:hypothetical protein